MVKGPFRPRTLALMVGGVTALYMSLTAYENRNSLFRAFVMPTMRRLPIDASQKLLLLTCKYRLYPASPRIDDENLKSSFFGKNISNPIGIAAGFDRNAEALLGLRDLGFGFLEIGSVTPTPQRGGSNPGILNQLRRERAMISPNSVDSDGHCTVLNRIRKTIKRKDFTTVVGVNLSSGRGSLTPIRDYLMGVRSFSPYVDYLVVNADTHLEAKGRRRTANKSRLIDLLSDVNQVLKAVSTGRKVPVLLKLSADLTDDQMKEIALIVVQPKCRVDGLIVSSASVAHNQTIRPKFASVMGGGIAGAPLRKRSTRMIARMYELTGGKIPIIGVGGVASGRDAFEKIEAGASFVQIYTALVYEGPDLVERIKEDLSSQLSDRGYANVQQAIGSNYRKYLPSNKEF